MNIIINFRILVNEKNYKGVLMQNFHELVYNDKGISLLGVKEVIEFSDKEIYLSLHESGLRIIGRDLKITEVDLEKGSLKASGAILSLSYGGNAKEGLIKRLFK